jgi:hypothetical protein
MTAHPAGYLAKYLTKTRADQAAAQSLDLPAGRAVIASPVGAIVTGQLHAFAVEPLDVLLLPVRVRCTTCPWQATTTGLADAAVQASRHAAAHQMAGGAA